MSNYLRQSTEHISILHIYPCVWFQCEIFRIAVAFVKNRYAFQTWNTKGIIDVKEKMWLVNIK